MKPYSTKSTQSPPDYHYYREPYRILSFIAGLYLDPLWSDKEFEKWSASEHKGKDTYYYYKGFLEPYGLEGTPAGTVISDEVHTDSRNVPDGRGRFAPNADNCEKVWPDLVQELSSPPGKHVGRLPAFRVEKRVLSALAGIFLTDDEDYAKLRISECDPSIQESLRALAEARGKAAEVESLLTTLKPAIFADLEDPPNCW